MKDTDVLYSTEGEDRTHDIETQLEDNIRSLTALYHHFIEDAS